MRKVRRHGRCEGKRGGDASDGGREQRSVGQEQGMSVGGRGIGREGNFKGSTPRIQYTADKTTHSAALAIATLLLQTQNDCKWVYLNCEL